MSYDTTKIDIYWRLCLTFAVLCVGSTAKSALIDFTTDDKGEILVNGQAIESPDKFGKLVSITAKPATGAAIFDSTPGGPNKLPETEDMLVGLGNVLIVQSHLHPTQTVPGIFDTPVDATQGGNIFFDFVSPSLVQSIDLIDIDSNANAELRLTDVGGKARVYTVPKGWTHDLRDSPDGYATLNLESLADQTGETDIVATATEEAGFDPTMVSQLQVTLFGSGGVDNLAFVPEPNSAGLAGIAVLSLFCTMRKRLKRT